MAAELTINPSDLTAAENTAINFSKDGLKLSISTGTVTADQIRIFQGQTLTFKAAKITKVVFTCTANGTAKYGPGSFGEGAPEGYTFDAAGPTGTWAGDAASVSFTATDKQVRATSIVVTYEPAEPLNPDVSFVFSSLVPTDTIEWTDATASYGWWQVMVSTDELFLTLSNYDAVTAPSGEYDAESLDPDYSFFRTETDSVNLAIEGSLTVAVSESGDTVTVNGVLKGSDGKNYGITILYIKAEVIPVDMTFEFAENEEGITITPSAEEPYYFTWIEADTLAAYYDGDAIAYAEGFAAYYGTAIDNYTSTGAAQLPFADLLEDGYEPGEYVLIVFGFNGGITTAVASYNFTLEESTEGIENIVLTEKAQKVVVDGAVYVIRDNKLFNIVGARVR